MTLGGVGGKGRKCVRRRNLTHGSISIIGTDADGHCRVWHKELSDDEAELGIISVPPYPAI